jgi:hypothetical protein
MSLTMSDRKGAEGKEKEGFSLENLTRPTRRCG